MVAAGLQHACSILFQYKPTQYLVTCSAACSYLLLLDEHGVGGLKVHQASLAVLQVLGGSLESLLSRAHFSLLQGTAVREGGFSG